MTHNPNHVGSKISSVIAHMFTSQYGMVSHGGYSGMLGSSMSMSPYYGTASSSILHTTRARGDASTQTMNGTSTSNSTTAEQPTPSVPILTEHETMMLSSLTTVVTSMLIKYGGIDSFYFGPLYQVMLYFANWGAIRMMSHLEWHIGHTLLCSLVFSFLIAVYARYIKHHKATEKKSLLGEQVSPSLSGFAEFVGNYFANVPDVLMYQLRRFHIVTSTEKCDVQTLTIRMPADKAIWTEYVKYFPSFFSPASSYCIGIVNETRNPNAFTHYLYYDTERPEDTVSIPFVDTNFEPPVRGVYAWNTFVVEGAKGDASAGKTDTKFFYEVIKISLQTPDPSTICPVSLKGQSLVSTHFRTPGKIQTSVEYFECIRHMIAEKRKHAHIERVEIRVFKPDVTVVTPFYKGPQLSIEELEKKFLGPFFHPQKYDIWESIKLVHYTPEKLIDLGLSPQVGYLAYGAAGTGKSRFGEVICRMTNTHPYHVNILSLKTKHAIYKAIKQPFHPSKEQALTPRDVTFFFDEFDSVVTFLYNRSKKREMTRERMYHRAWGPHAQHRMTRNGNHGDDENTSGSIGLSSLASASRDTSSKSAAVDTKTESVGNVKTRASEKRKKKVEALGLDDLEDEEAEEYASLVPADDDYITFRELLELIQGVIPMFGAKIYATTNHLEVIRKCCPELIRFGRLTPIEFKPLTLSVLEQMTQFYFKETSTITELPSEHICIAEIVDIAAKMCLKQKTREDFEHHMRTVTFPQQTIVEEKRVAALEKKLAVRAAKSAELQLQQQQHSPPNFYSQYGPDYDHAFNDGESFTKVTFGSGNSGSSGSHIDLNDASWN